MPSTDCIWNRDLHDFDNCCIWAYVVCKGKCESYQAIDNKRIGVLTVKCPECEEK